MPLAPICSICCDYFTPDCIIKATKCGHLFHGPCIVRWLKNTLSCPECRQSKPVLLRVYHNFFNSAEDGENDKAKSSDAQQKQIEKLKIKLSMEEAKNKQADQRLQELQTKFRDQLQAAKLKDEEHLKVLKALREKASQEAFGNMKKTRQTTEGAEKLLIKEMSARPLEKPKSTINHSRCCPRMSTVIKVVTSSRPQYVGGVRVRDTATSTSISTTSKTTTSSHSSFAGATTSTASLPKPFFSRNMSRSHTGAAANASLPSHHFDYLSSKLF